jgi:hypothetical protein
LKPTPTHRQLTVLPFNRVTNHWENPCAQKRKKSTECQRPPAKPEA